jgi:hypothetical protein
LAAIPFCLSISASSIVGEFLATFRDYPPRQKAASFTIRRLTYVKFRAQCPRLAQGGHPDALNQCLLSREKRTLIRGR